MTAVYLSSGAETAGQQEPHRGSHLLSDPLFGHLEEARSPGNISLIPGELDTSSREPGATKSTLNEV